MNLETEYFIKSNNTQKLKLLAKQAISNKELLSEIMDYVLLPEKYNKYAAWVLGYVVQQSRTALKPYMPQLLNALLVREEDDLIGMTLYAFAQLDFPFENAGGLLDYCIKQLTSKKGKPYFKTYALKIIVKFCVFESKLAHEMISVLNDAVESMPNKSTRKACEESIVKISVLLSE